MLFMDIWTWSPERRDEIEKRWSEFKYPEEIKLIGEWLDITGNRIFVLYECDDPESMLIAGHYWTDIAEGMSIPVIDTKELAKITAKLRK